MIETTIIKGMVSIKTLRFDKHFLRRKKNRVKEQCGLTVVVEIEGVVTIGGLKIDLPTIEHSQILTADEFNILRKELNGSPSVAGGD